MRERVSTQDGYGRLISPEQISLITGMDDQAAEREHQYVRDLFDTGSDDLLLEQYCHYAELDFKETEDFLYNPMLESQLEQEELLWQQMSEDFPLIDEREFDFSILDELENSQKIIKSKSKKPDKG